MTYLRRPQRDSWRMLSNKHRRIPSLPGKSSDQDLDQRNHYEKLEMTIPGARVPLYQRFNQDENPNNVALRRSFDMD